MYVYIIIINYIDIKSEWQIMILAILIFNTNGNRTKKKLGLFSMIFKQQRYGDFMGFKRT